MRGRGKRAGEGEGNCEDIPTPKQCPSWVVAKFKARSCNPHTGRRLRFLFYHDSEVANYSCYHLFADFFFEISQVFFGFYSWLTLYLATSPMRRSTPAQSVRGTPRRARTALADTTTPLDSPTTLPVGPKPPTTFISSLEIPVQGALPIPQPPGIAAKSSPLSSTSAPPPLTPAAPSSASAAASSGRRAPRRSKTEALAALQSAAHADGADDVQPPTPTLFQPDAAPLPAAPRLDMNTVRTPPHSRRTPGSAQQASPKERPFGLKDCPAFYPTPEEFRDPMSYIRAISTEAREYGIAKIVPPETWRMPFVTDTEVRHPILLLLVQSGGEQLVSSCRNLDSRRGCSVSILLRRRHEPRSTFWNSCTVSISKRVTRGYPYPRSIISPWICGSYARRCKSWVAMMR